MNYTRAIVRKPCKNMIHGLTSANLGTPDFNLAQKQHAAYIKALELCCLQVTVLEADEKFPDSTFVEDTAILTSDFAIITRPGAPSRRGEIDRIKPVLEKFYNHIEQIEAPGTLEAGDVMKVGIHYYIGLSNRTNEEGANQLIDILNNYGLTGSKIYFHEFLHLKSGLAFLENNALVTTGEFTDLPEFNNFNKIVVPREETYAANCLWINETVLIAAGFPKTKQLIEAAGYKTISLDMSEFQKLDGGLSCLSLRF